MKKEKGITLVTLIAAIVIMLILTGVVINLTIGENGIFQKSKQSAGIHNNQEATEKINLKITNTQMRVYAENQRMPTLQEVANDFCEDEEIQYVELESKRTASFEKVEIGNSQSFFTKLKAYPYEFEIDSSLKLASINGIKLAENDTTQSDLLARLEQMELTIQTLQTDNEMLKREKEDLKSKIDKLNTNKYTLLGSTQGKTKLNFDYTNYQAINIITVLPKNGEHVFFSSVIPVSQLTSNSVQWFSDGTDGSSCWWCFSNKSIFVELLKHDSKPDDLSSSSTTYVYGI